MLTIASTQADRTPRLASKPPPSSLKSALDAQSRARDTLLMPPPARQTPSSREQTNSAPVANRNSDVKRGFASPTAASAARSASVSVASSASNLRPKSAASSSLSLKRNASKVNSPATPRPGTATPFSSNGGVNQLSRPSQKPKPFHQKLLDANLSTPPKSSSKNLVTPVEIAFDLHSSCKVENTALQTTVRALTELLNNERTKVTELEGLLHSRNTFISNIEKIAQSTTEKLAINQTVLLAHLEDTKKMELRTSFVADNCSDHLRQNRECNTQGAICCCHEFYDDSTEGARSEGGCCVYERCQPGLVATSRPFDIVISQTK